MILTLFLFIGTWFGHHCSHDQYRCYYRDYNFTHYHYYDFSECIDSTLACNGHIDCYFGTSDEEGCGMILATVQFVCIYSILCEQNVHICMLATKLTHNGSQSVICILVSNPSIPSPLHFNEYYVLHIK